MEISKKIVELIKDTKSVYVPVKEDMDLYRDLDFDSLEFMQLIINVEETFSITLGLLEIDRCRRVEQLIKTVEGKLEGAGS
jgi:Acyl carrier protein